MFVLTNVTICVFKQIFFISFLQLLAEILFAIIVIALHFENYFNSCYILQDRVYISGWYVITIECYKIQSIYLFIF